MSIGEFKEFFFLPVILLNEVSINYLHIKERIIAHQRNPFIPTTNNLLEGFHKKYTYYPSFKRNMMIPEGAQRVLDYRVFRHNFGKFPNCITKMQKDYENYRILAKETHNHPSIRGGRTIF